MKPVESCEVTLGDKQLSGVSVISGESINSAGTVMSTGFLAPADITASFISSSSDLTDHQHRFVCSEFS